MVPYSARAQVGASSKAQFGSRISGTCVHMCVHACMKADMHMCSYVSGGWKKTSVVVLPWMPSTVLLEIGVSRI